MDEDQIFSFLLSYVEKNGFSERRFIFDCEYIKGRTHNQCIQLWKSFINAATNMYQHNKTPAEAIQWLLESAFPIASLAIYNYKSLPIFFSEEARRSSAIRRNKEAEEKMNKIINNIYSIQNLIYQGLPLHEIAENYNI